MSCDMCGLLQEIQDTLFRNVGLAFVCVTVVTLLLIISLPTCLTVLVSVVLTVVRIPLDKISPIPRVRVNVNPM